MLVISSAVTLECQSINENLGANQNTQLSQILWPHFFYENLSILSTKSAIFLVSVVRREFMKPHSLSNWADG